MSGFREPEISREQMVLWSRRPDDAIPVDHPVRHLRGVREVREAVRTNPSHQHSRVLVLPVLQGSEEGSDG